MSTYDIDRFLNTWQIWCDILKGRYILVSFVTPYRYYMQYQKISSLNFMNVASLVCLSSAELKFNDNVRRRPDHDMKICEHKTDVFHI
jgi:hypothetical protein